MKNRNRSLKGNLNPAKREEVKKKIRKKYQVLTPTKEEIIVENISKFCKENNLNYRCLIETGKNRGYICQKI